jgi:hypothetical protein
METLALVRILAGPRRGSSRPVLAETSAGKHLVKLRGAAQGTGPLIAEIVVSALAEALDLPVLPRRLAVLTSDTPTDDKNDELADLLRASVGLNLAFPFLEHAHDATPDDLVAFDPSQRAATLWLDRLVLNPDRTVDNSNILANDGKLYLIDHGSSLSFQYRWADVTEGTPHEIGVARGAHVFEAESDSEEWLDLDGLFAERTTRAVLESALADVPATFLLPLLSGRASGNAAADEQALRRRRAAYVAFLWKRLQPPRTFARPRRASTSAE